MIAVAVEQAKKLWLGSAGIMNPTSNQKFRLRRIVKHARHEE
jgi:hypothetical protein